MLKLIATCALVGTFSPPEGWTLKSASVWQNPCSGSTCFAIYAPHFDPFVTIERTVKPGDRIELPASCKLAVEKP